MLDLGTNNCRLLIARPAADERFWAIDSFSRIVRLGEGVAASGLISDAAMDRTIAALKICAQHIEKSGAQHVRAIATQAARLAGNSDVLIARARDEAGITLTVISADEEADLAALGCAPLIGHKYKGALIFDIGGGSTEIIHLLKLPGGFEKKFTASLPFGVVTLSESYGSSAQSRTGLEKMKAAMRDNFAPWPGQEAFDPKTEHLLGTSGTVTTLAALALKLPRYNRAKVDASWYETSRMLGVVERIARTRCGGAGQAWPHRAGTGGSDAGGLGDLRGDLRLVAQPHAAGRRSRPARRHVAPVAPGACSDEAKRPCSPGAAKMRVKVKKNRPASNPRPGNGWRGN